MEKDTFCTLLHRVRAGDPDAVAELVRRFEPAIRRYVRLHLTDPRLRRVLDSADICQSVWGAFFVRAAAGQFDLECPEQLVKLLAAMARNRFLNHTRDQQADCRDLRRVEGGDELLSAVADGGNPSEIVAGQDLLHTVLRRLPPEERHLAGRPAEGWDWAEIAAEQGESAGALRKRLARALGQVAQDLGLEGVRRA